MVENMMTILLSLILILISPQIVFADSYQDKLEFASSLEETLGHFWAIEQNLDDGNSELALVHATHPISELYVLMKPTLVEIDPKLDAQVQETLMQLQHQANTEVSREQAQKALEDAKKVVEIARSTIVGDGLSNDTLFQAELIKILLKTSTSEYSEAVSNGIINEMAEFQDGSAFVWKSEQIFRSIESDIESHVAEEIDKHYEDLWAGYDKKADPEQIEIFANGIIHEIDGVLGVEDQGNELLDYVENIRYLLEQTKIEYGNGNNDIALSLATRAYLDNYEYLEGPLIDLGQEELMKEVEIMLREELREMIKNEEPASQINNQVEEILDKMNNIATAVPEFSTITMMILVVSIISIVTITTKSKIRITV